MYNLMPLLIVAFIIAVFTVIFTVAFVIEKRKKEPEGFERSMSDREIIRRLMVYCRPYWKSFVAVFLVMVLSIGYDLMGPLLIGDIQRVVKDRFELRDLYIRVAFYAGMLVISMICTYCQAMILQKTGQKILSALREDIFVHIEKLSHEQLNHIPVGKLVTRVSNDPNSISYMFTNVLVTLLKNFMVLFGVLCAMATLNRVLTLMVLGFVPFLVLYTVIFRKFSRKVHRRVNEATTDVNTYLSENLSGMKITQAFNQEDRKMEDFLVKSVALKKAKRDRMLVFGIFRPMVYMLFITCNLCLFYLGARG